MAAYHIPSIATIARVNGQTLGADVINNLHPEIRIVITIRPALYQRETAFGVVMHSSENLHKLTRLVAAASWIWAGMLLRSLYEHRQAAQLMIPKIEDPTNLVSEEPRDLLSFGG
jgi:hypothetical protein